VKVRKRELVKKSVDDRYPIDMASSIPGSGDAKSGIHHCLINN
jgi:hypothetical protein